MRHLLVKKFIVLSTLFFLICLNNHILRNLKETVIITNPELGINAIPFIKTWLMLPIILLFVNAYVYLSRRFSQKTVTSIILSSILIYFLLFLFILYPHHAKSHWNLSLFYCIAEVWGTVVMMILFWGTCNRSTDLDEAKRFYSPILAISNLSGIAAAQTSIYCSQNCESWDATLSTLTLFVCLITVAILGLFYCLPDSTQTEAPKERISLISAIRYIAGNLKFRSLAFTIFAYYFCSGILELILKYQLLAIYPDANEFNDVLNQMTICVSIASTLITTFVTGSMIRRFSWRVTALATPLLLTLPLTALVVHYFFSASEAVVLAAVYAAYFMLSRMCKFTFFDLSKEIANVGFSPDEQIQSKSVLDGIIPKFAKTSESLFLQLLMTICLDLSQAIPFIILLSFGIHLVWIYSTKTIKLQGAT